MHRTVAFYASKADAVGNVPIQTEHGVVWIRAEAGRFPMPTADDGDAPSLQHLDACQPREGETVLNTIDLDEQWSTEVESLEQS